MPCKVLFVCLGNICRSPMAEAVFNHMVLEKGLTGQYSADSAGTANYHVGERPDYRTLQVLEQNGIFTAHRGRQVSAQDFFDFDLILAMDNANLKNVKNICPKTEWLPKVKLLLEYSAQSSVKEVPDPYYGSLKDFEYVYRLVTDANKGLLSTLI